MKRLLLLLVFAASAANTFAWYKAALFFSNGTVTQQEIKLPGETLSGIFNRAIVVKDGENENSLALSNISKVVLSNGITFIKFDNNGKPVLLQQVTQYSGINILILPSLSSPNFVEADHYVYRLNGNTTFEEQPVTYNFRNETRTTTDPITGAPTLGIRDYSNTPVDLYYSSLTRNGRLYVPGENDYIYLMKGDQIERLQSVRAYATLNKFMGDDKYVGHYIKKGLSSFAQLTSLVSVYNANANFKQ